MQAIGHTRSEHQSKLKKEKKKHEGTDMVEDHDIDETLDQEIEYDTDIVDDDDADEEGHAERMDLEEDGDDASIADEEQDYSYVMDEVSEEDADAEELLDGEDHDAFDWFATN